MTKKLFITISPIDRTHSYSLIKFKNPQRCVFLDDRIVIENTLRKNKIKNYVFYPELDPKGRLHYHGRIDVTRSQEVSYYKAVKPVFQRIGFVDNSEVKHNLENLIYCMKDWSQTKEILQIDRPIEPQFLNIRLGGRRGFKSQRDLDIEPCSNILNYFGI